MPRLIAYCKRADFAPPAEMPTGNIENALLADAVARRVASRRVASTRNALIERHGRDTT